MNRNRRFPHLAEKIEREQLARRQLRDAGANVPGVSQGRELARRAAELYERARRGDPANPAPF